MDNFETPYDEDAEFILCSICDKSIKGDSLYKIHLTTPAHLKKEDSLVAAGLAVRQHNVPLFEDIIHYLDYMRLEEPIIGLGYLDEVPGNDPQGGPTYTCRLCHQTSNLTEMVRHVIGRKHRQKYMSVKRPDLVKDNIINQGGKAIRAKAEIIERQDGRGAPQVITKRGIPGKSNVMRVPPRQKQSGDRNFSQGMTQRNVTSHLPKLMDFQHDSQESYPQIPRSTHQCHPEDSYMLNQNRQMNLEENILGHSRMRGEQRRADYRENDMRRRDRMEPDISRECEEEYGADPQRRAVPGPSGAPRYDSRVEMPGHQAQRADYYPEESPLQRRTLPERDILKEFYTEEVMRGRVRSAEHQPSQPVYPEGDSHQWSRDRVPGRPDSRDRAGRQGSHEPEAKRRAFPAQTESDNSHEHLFSVIKDYGHMMRFSQQGEAVANPGPGISRPSRSPSSQRQVELPNSMSDIPEPFRRFLKGANNNEEQGKRKRKSRFSDATAEEMQTTREMFIDEHGPPNPKYGSHPRPLSAFPNPEIHGIQHHDLFTESQGSHPTEIYQRGGPESGDVFDMLKNVEIENAEEANFLKSKLCNLLKEFKVRKSEKSGQNSQGRAAIFENYDNLRPEPELSSRNQYKEDLDLRQHEDPYFEGDNRGRSWNHPEHIPDERHQEYVPPMNRVRGDSRTPGSNRNYYDDDFAQSVGHPTESTHYPERFQEPMHSRDYRPASGDFMDSRSSAPPLHMEQRPRLDRGPRYSNNLDKITSTLLELVARK